MEKVIKVQADSLKSSKSTGIANPTKAKKSVSSSPATSAPSSPMKSPVKVKKLVVPVDQTSSAAAVEIPPKPTVITVNLDALVNIDSTLPKKNYYCHSCQFAAASEELLEVHVVKSHASESTQYGIQICLECGFKPTSKQTLVCHQKKTKHTRTNEISDDVVTEAGVSAENPKKGRIKPPHPYRCKHCTFTAVTEHGMNLHWQRLHSAAQLPLEFDCDLPPEVNAAKPESAKIYYRCQLCSVQPGLYEELREHAREVHPHAPVKIFRITSKVRNPPEPSTPVVAGASKDPGPPPLKVARDEKPLAKEAVSTVTQPIAIKSQPPKLTPKPGVGSAAANSQTVFVVAPQQGAPAYTCAWCNSKFQQESQVNYT